MHIPFAISCVCMDTSIKSNADSTVAFVAFVLGACFVMQSFVPFSSFVTQLLRAKELNT